MRLKLTPEWVLEKIPHTRYTDGDGNISVYTNNATNANLIELALDSLQINYHSFDGIDDNGELGFGFDFRIEDIKDDCPTFYQKVKEIDNKNLIN